VIRVTDAELVVPDKLKEAVSFIHGNPSFVLSGDNVKKVESIWKEKTFRKIWEENRKYFHNSHLDYFIENLARITSDDYVPTNQDIVRSRQFTIGASTTTFYYQNFWWKIIDVGGQIPERRKWSNIVRENAIKGLVYFVALDEYNVYSQEEKGKTNMQVSLKVWSDVVSGEEFSGMFLLFLNKMDNFEEIISNNYDDFKKVYTKYKGGETPEECANFIKDMFIKRAVKTGKEEKNLFAHFTCAIDGDKIAVTWRSLYEYIVSKRMNMAGFEL